MDLEAIAGITKSAIIILVNEKGEVKDSYPKENDLGSDINKIGAFTRVVLNMSSDFFDNFFDAKISDVSLRTGSKSMFLYKYDDENLLCFFSETNINTALIGLTLKKK